VREVLATGAAVGRWEGIERTGARYTEVCTTLTEREPAWGSDAVAVRVAERYTGLAGILRAFRSPTAAQPVGADQTRATDDF
jgi:hypothetical protein